ncbi:hypothetical protein [Methylobacterium sp. J-070]|uniref:hypothetical protein n=1 Tax=Methylobacterium sp. J-070 TaxID=2836650 RepID=UPI001FB8A804|nr:hypothetical protein [Methylobacterium sp. J-070]MCJ2048770.1 hypothetical protein [Methylobacterium sp. J-070]
MNRLAQIALARQIAQAEQAILRLLGGLETGVATGRIAETHKSAIRRHGRVILDAGGRDALAAVADRISDVPGLEADRRALLAKLWSDLGKAPE